MEVFGLILKEQDSLGDLKHVNKFVILCVGVFVLMMVVK
jgi:hypothetical protein